MLTRYLLLCILLVGCRNNDQHQPTMRVDSKSSGYEWKKLADTAAFLPTDRLQFMNIRDTLWAFHSKGNYYSTNGIDFHLSTLEPIASPTGISGYIFSGNKLISLSSSEVHKGLTNATGIIYSSIDLQDWKQEPSSTMPIRSSYHPIGFKGKFWIFGGNDSTNLPDAWNSDDAIHWKKVVDSLPFGPIDHQYLVVFRKKLVLLSNHLWDSEDGIHWKKVPTTTVPILQRSTPVLFNDKLWIFGAGFKNGENGKILVSADTKKWDTLNAPWLERSSPAVCIFRGKILFGGGNHQLISGNMIKDSLLNDIWQMEYTNPADQ